MPWFLMQLSMFQEQCSPTIANTIQTLTTLVIVVVAITYNGISTSKDHVHNNNLIPNHDSMTDSNANHKNKNVNLVKSDNDTSVNSKNNYTNDPVLLSH